MNNKNNYTCFIDDTFVLDNFLGHQPINMSIKEINDINKRIQKETHNILTSVNTLVYDLSDILGSDYAELKVSYCQFNNAGSFYAISLLESDYNLDFIKKLNKKIGSNFKIADNCPPQDLVKGAFDNEYKKQTEILSDILHVDVASLTK